jgi:hypothetical protein
MTLTKTQDELIARALTKLKVIGSGQSPDAEDRASVAAAIDGVLADLRARDVANVADVEAIPTEWFESLADLLAQAVADDFGAERDADRIAAAEAALRRKAAVAPTYQVQRAQYF